MVDLPQKPRFRNESSDSFKCKEKLAGIGKKGRNYRLFVWLLLVIAGLIGYLIYDAHSYEEVVTTDQDGNPILTPDRQGEITRRQKKNAEEAEQYVLRAIAPGYRECYLCPEGRVWLETNEIAKIGVSTNGQSRFTIEFYETHNVYYVTEYRGDLTTAKNREITRLGNYPLLLELDFTTFCA